MLPGLVPVSLEYMGAAIENTFDEMVTLSSRKLILSLDQSAPGRIHLIVFDFKDSRVKIFN